MATEISSIARPYAEAVFSHASENNKLDLWSEMLAFMSTAVKDENLSVLINNPPSPRYPGVPGKNIASSIECLHFDPHPFFSFSCL